MGSESENKVDFKKIDFSSNFFLWISAEILQFWKIAKNGETKKIKNRNPKINFFDDPKNFQKFFKSCQEWSCGLGDKILGHF